MPERSDPDDRAWNGEHSNGAVVSIDEIIEMSS